MGDMRTPAGVECTPGASGSQKPGDCRWLQAKQLRPMADHLPGPAELAAEFDNPANQPDRARIANPHAEQRRSVRENRQATVTVTWPLPRVLLLMLQSPPAAPTNHPDLQLNDSGTARAGWAEQRLSICESFLFSQGVLLRHLAPPGRRLRPDSRAQAYSLHQARLRPSLQI